MLLWKLSGKVPVSVYAIAEIKREISFSSLVELKTYIDLFVPFQNFVKECPASMLKVFLTFLSV